MMPTATTTTALIDPDAIRQSLRRIVPEQTTEVRILDAKLFGSYWRGTHFGYFDDHEAVISALETVEAFEAVWIIPNPMNPDLLARCANRIERAGKGDTTSDNDIVRRRWLLIDCDPVRPSGISSTEAEHDAALVRAREVDHHLWEFLCFPKPIYGDSGNGAHLLYPVDLPANDGGMVQRLLEGLATRFDDDKVKIDTTTFNPARALKLYGTRACKGDNITRRPHRMARIIGD